MDRTEPECCCNIQNVVPEVTYKQVVETVIVVVTHAATLSPSRVSQTGLGGYIGESSITIVAKQVAGGVSIAYGRIKAGSIYKEDVKPAVVVVVEPSHATAHFFEEELLILGPAANVARLRQPSGGGYIFKHNREGRSSVQRALVSKREGGPQPCAA